MVLLIKKIIVRIFFSLLPIVTSAQTITLPSNVVPYALVLFYAARCPHCQRFVPIVKDYARQHQMPVLAYTLDGESLPSFPDSILPTAEEVHRFFPTQSPVVPALFLLEFRHQQLIPVLVGEATKRQLSERLNTLLSKENV